MVLLWNTWYIMLPAPRSGVCGGGSGSHQPPDRSGGHLYSMPPYHGTWFKPCAAFDPADGKKTLKWYSEARAMFGGSLHGDRAG